MTTLVPKYDQGATGAVNRPFTEKLTEYVSVKDFGAVGNGVVDDTAAIQAALNVAGDIYIPTGTYKITSSLTFGNNTNIVFDKKARFNAGVNNLTFFLVTNFAYFSQIRNATLYGNGFTGVTGFDLTNFRLQSGLFDCNVNGMEYGIIFRYGCFNTPIANFTSFDNTPRPITIMDNCGGVFITDARLDCSGNLTGTSIGIDIQVGATIGPNIGCVIEGGYTQSFNIGVRDKGWATKINNMYFEICATADIFFDGARNSEATGTNHFADSGPVGIKSTSSDAISIFYPSMGASNRSTGLFDFDATNTNCAYYITGSNAFINAPLGVTTGLSSIPIQSTGTFTPIVFGTTTAGVGTYTNQKGTWSKTGNIVTFTILVSWSAHTGTGNISISGLPTALTPSDFTYVSSFLTIPSFAYTGPVVSTQFAASGTTMTAIQTSTAGTTTLIPLAASGGIAITGSYRV